MGRTRCRILAIALTIIGSLGLPESARADYGVAMGGQHTIALNNDGSVWTWGFNAYGQLGDGTTTTRSVPGLVPGVINVIQIAAGENHSLALRVDGTLW